MTLKLTIKDVERITVNVPFTPRCQVWNSREQYQWSISEVVRVTTDVPDLVGYGETMLHYTWGRVPDDAIARVKGRNPADFLGDDTLGAGLQMAIYDLVGKALGVPAHRLLNLPRVREWCPISWWNVDMSPEDWAAEAQEAVSKGYTSHKLKGRPWWDIYAQIEAHTREIQELAGQRQHIYEQQRQIQGSLAPLGREGEEGALRARYIATLGELEDRLATLAAEEQRLKAENARLEEEASKQLAGLTSHIG